MRASRRRIAPGVAVMVMATTGGACGLPRDGGDAVAGTALETTAAPPAPAMPVVDGQAVVHGTGYEFTVPGGWQRVASAMANDGASVDVAIGVTVANPPGTGRVHGTIAVMIETGSWVDLSDYTANHRDRLAGQAIVALPEPRTIAGVPAATLDFTYEEGSTRVHTRQVLCLHSERAYVVALFTTEPPPAAELAALDAVLATWTWV